MSESTPMPKKPMDWTLFQEYLTDYVRLELSGETAEIVYPVIAYFIETIPQCEAAYYEEFQRQGEQTPIEVLRRINAQDNLEPWPLFLQEREPDSDFAPEPQPNWYEMSLEHGKAWLDEETDRWQQIWLTLASAFARPDNRQALAGLMRSSPSTEPAATTLMRVGGDDADIEVVVAVRPDPFMPEDYSILEVAIDRQDVFGDFSGIEVSLRLDEESHQAITDSLGKARFDKIANTLLQSADTPLQLVITMPDD